MLHCRGLTFAGWWLPAIIGLPLVLLLQTVCGSIFTPRAGRDARVSP